MTFSKYIKYALPAIFLLTLCACDEIDEQDRFQKVEIASGGESGGEGGGEGTGFGAKNVLIEDFTGQRCSNCPLAANTISTLQTSFGHDRVIPVAIHGGDLTMAAPTGLANAIGNTYTAERGVSSKPKGEVDRTGQLLDQEKWGTAVLERIAMTAHVKLGVENIAFDADSRELSFSVKTAADLTGAQGLLQVWLTESHIHTYQKTPDPNRFPQYPASGNDHNYEHNHVLRACVSAKDGDALTLVAGGSETRTYKYILDADWVADNMSVIVIAYNAAEGVLQVIEQPVQLP